MPENLTFVVFSTARVQHGVSFVFDFQIMFVNERERERPVIKSTSKVFYMHERKFILK